MPAYQYKALDEKKSIQKGILEADSSRQVRQQLRDKSWLPIEVVAILGDDKSKPKRQKSPSAYDLALITRQLSVLLASAIPLEESLASVAKQSEKQPIKSLMLSVRSHVLEGYDLATSLDNAADFPPLYIATITAGEKSGHLDLILEQLSEYTEGRFALQKKIQGAMIYPIILMIVALAIVIGLMTFVVPEIIKVFEKSDQALPLVTTIVLGISNVITQWWWLILIVTGLSVFFFIKFIRTDGGREVFDSVVLKLPIFAKLSKSLNASRFASTLSILSRSGVPLIEGLKIGAEVVGNVHVRRTIELAAEKVTEGTSLSSQLEQSPYFPPMMVQMIKSGENSGELENMLTRASKMQEDEASNLISTLLTLLEPLMLVLMGCVVMTIVMAVMLPIINMSNIAG